METTGMKFAVLDFETTGTSTTDTIIQVGLVIIDEFDITDRYTSLVNPGVRIPSSITSLTGITDEMVENAPSVEKVMADLYPLLSDCVLVAHHASFDHAFLQRSLTKAGYPPFTGRVLDTIDALRVAFPSLGSFQLGHVCSLFGIEDENPHQANCDAQVTAELWIRIMQKLFGLPLLTIQRISQILDPNVSDLGWFINEIRAYKELHTAEDEETYRYYRQFALNVDDWGKEEPVRDEQDVLNLGTFDEYMQQVNDSFKKVFPNYEAREAQQQMIHEVASAFEDTKHLMIEAGTGTGKTLGYLIPALYYGIKHEEKIVVSTHTINLQEQLRERDIPLLHHILPIGFTASVLKGRSHYLCLRKFENKMNIRDYDPGKEDTLTAAQMTVWLNETERGEDEELYFGNRGMSFWHQVSSDADSCMNRHCPWFRKCFYHRARYEAGESDVVITNHSLLLTDTKAENRLLPSYKHLILDEAHHFEDVAGKHLGTDLHYMGLANQLSQLYKDSHSGQLPMLLSRFYGIQNDKITVSLQAVERISERIVDAKEEWDRLTEKMYEWLSGNHESSGAETGQLIIRVKEDVLPDNWHEFAEIEENLLLALQDIHKKLDQLIQELKEVQDEYDLQSILTDLGGISKEIAQYKQNIRFFMKREDQDFVYWLEANTYTKSRSVQLVCVPLDVSPLLRDLIFDTKDSVIMTSATLSVNKSFSYSLGMFGLESPEEGQEKAKLRTVMLPSTFNYRQQALVMIPRDFPGIRGRQGEALFVEALIHSLMEVAITTRGRMLVLFTSNRMLKDTHKELKEKLRPYGIEVLGQGVDTGNRSKLTRLFQESEACVLLGTSSFWEGVDIPGQALTCLAIVRLPFQPPNHPLVEAKSEKLKKMNQNPFIKLSVPQAVIRFKQGFGRLVRTATDKGIVILYDTRVIETQYGKYFLYSLPGPKMEHMTRTQIVPRIEEWMGEKQE